MSKNNTVHHTYALSKTQNIKGTIAGMLMAIQSSSQAATCLQHSIEISTVPFRTVVETDLSETKTETERNGVIIGFFDLKKILGA